MIAVTLSGMGILAGRYRAPTGLVARPSAVDNPGEMARSRGCHWPYHTLSTGEYQCCP